MAHLDDMVGHRCDFVHVGMDNMENIVGSCNGLICLSTEIYNLTIWNPSTGKAYNLPYNPTKIRYSSILDSPTRTSTIFGFGHDSISDDYKFITFSFNGPKKLMAMKVETRDNNIFFCTELWVYSLKTKSWTISSSPSFPSKQYMIVPKYGVFASNALHWIMVRQDFNLIPYEQFLIGAFNLGSDNQLYEVQLPDLSNFNNVIHIILTNLSVLNGCLCLCTCHRTVMAPIDIWVMKVYSVKESWTRLFSFLPTGPDLSMTTKPLAYSRCGDKVMLLDCYDTYSKLIWYDLKTKNITTILLLGEDGVDICLAEVYMYNLVDPNNYK
ncbi:F-box protein CPR1-like [Actinidia eriantha]|uniref:F-box protein CPR1-like n=1 Tax=Actinidia eriantha TaxID=165200 RepID=UPI00258D3DBB|nr:F-box protein CPR1-like [Actinidia eriantha]